MANLSFAKQKPKDKYETLPIGKRSMPHAFTAAAPNVSRRPFFFYVP